MSQTQEQSARLGLRIKRALGQPPPVSDERLRRQFVSAVIGEPSPTGARRPLRWAAAGVTLGSIAVCTWWLITGWGARAHAVRDGAVPALGVTAVAGQGQGRVVGEGSGLQTDPGAMLKLRFEGGSAVELDQGSRGTLVRARQGAVEVLLAQGTLRADVRREAGATFVVAAGPYRVTVIGTRFSVRWVPLHGRLTVKVERGRVMVSGHHGRRVSLVAGQRLRAEVGAGRLQVVDRDATQWSDVEFASPTGPRPGADPEPAVSVSSLVASPVNPTSSHDGGGAGQVSVSRPAGALATVPGSPPTRDGVTALTAPSSVPEAVMKTALWSQLAEEGRHEALLRDAKALGIPSLLKRLGRQELWLLVEAARFRGEIPLAVSALNALRTRFPGSDLARRAAYLLGRAHAESLGQQAQACRWFSTYLAESPQGELAEEALGRMMDSCARCGRREAARLAARSYLSRYPRGVFRSLARSVLAQPPHRDPAQEVPPP